MKTKGKNEKKKWRRKKQREKRKTKNQNQNQRQKSGTPTRILIWQIVLLHSLLSMTMQLIIFHLFKSIGKTFLRLCPWLLMRRKKEKRKEEDGREGKRNKGFLFSPNLKNIWKENRPNFLSLSLIKNSKTPMFDLLSLKKNLHDNAHFSIPFSPFLKLPDRDLPLPLPLPLPLLILSSKYRTPLPTGAIIGRRWIWPNQFQLISSFLTLSNLVWSHIQLTNLIFEQLPSYAHIASWSPRFSSK